MGPLIRHLSHTGAQRLRACDSVRRYIQEHLQGAAEGGNLANYVNGYLDHNGAVKLVFLDRQLWRDVGLTDEEMDEGRIPAELLRCLQMGKHRSGKRLLPRVSARPTPVDEVLVTMPAEISQVAEAGILDIQALQMAILEEVHAQLCLKAVRISKGGRGDKGRVHYAPGRTLSLAVLHARNRENEPHLHPHILTFAPVFVGDGQWRSLAPRGHCQVLHREGGREAVGRIIQGALERAGVRVTWDLGRARDQVGADFGATLHLPDGQVIPAGDQAHARGAYIRAMREVYRQIRDLPPEKVAFDQLREQIPPRLADPDHPGHDVARVVMTTVRRLYREPRRKALPEGLPLAWLDRALARAQWWLQNGWPGARGEAASHVLQKVRNALRSKVGAEEQNRHTDEEKDSCLEQVNKAIKALGVWARGALPPASKAVLFSLQRRGLARWNAQQLTSPRKTRPRIM